ncbi:MAG: hypothetical protein HZB67_05235 [Candidatus Aenigmarchaeota archaeon]|nr:hypothetical protein [Candidatus Aenigmarchaeota archaeon]
MGNNGRVQDSKVLYRAKYLGNQLQDCYATEYILRIDLRSGSKDWTDISNMVAPKMVQTWLDETYGLEIKPLISQAIAEYETAIKKRKRALEADKQMAAAQELL